MQEISCSIPIRVRNQNFYATLAINVEGEFSQFWNGNNAVPQWTPTNKGPKLTPNVVIPSGANCTNIAVTWYRSDKGNTQGSSDLVEIAEFNIPTGGTMTGGVKNAFNTLIEAEGSDGSIRFIGDVATADNQDPDVFICEAEATVNGAKYKMRRSVTMNVSPTSANGKVLSISAANGTALSSRLTSLLLTAKAYDGQAGTVLNLTDFIVEWEWEQEPETVGGNRVRTQQGNTLTVYRDKDTTGRGTNPWVNWEQLVICRLYEKDTSKPDNKGNYLALATINITDQADLIRLDYNVSGDIDSSSPAIIKFWLEKRDNNNASAWSPFSPANAEWAAVIQDKIDNDTSQTWTGNFDSAGMAVHDETINGSTQSVDHITISMSQMSGWGITTGDMKVTAQWPD